MVHRILSLLLLVVAAGFLPAASASEVAIRLDNGTDASLELEGAEVTIVLPASAPEPGKPAWREETRPVAGRQAVFEIDGALAGTKLDVQVTYKGGRYFFADALEVGKEPGPLKVYEPSEDRAHLHLRQHYIQIRGEARNLHVQETLFVRNPSDRAYIGEAIPGVTRRTALVLAVPEGATSFSIKAGGLVSGETFAAAGPYRVSDAAIPPGEHTIGFSYHLSIPEGATGFAKEIPSDTEVVTIIAAAGEGAHFHVKGLEGKEVSDPHSGGIVHVFEAEGLKRGSKLEIEIHAGGHAAHGAAGDDSAHASAAGGWNWPWIALGVGCGIPLVLAAFHRPNRGGTASKEAERIREFLIDEVARLDAALEKGEIAAPFHQRERARLKAELLRLEERQGSGRRVT